MKNVYPALDYGNPNSTDEIYSPSAPEADVSLPKIPYNEGDTDVSTSLYSSITKQELSDDNSDGDSRTDVPMPRDLSNIQSGIRIVKYEDGNIEHIPSICDDSNGDSEINGLSNLLSDMDISSRGLAISQWAPSILLTNPQSITNCFGEFGELVETLKPDVVVVSETWFSKSRPAANHTLAGYNQFHCDRQGGRRGGGVAVYAKTTTNIKGLERATESIKVHLNSCVADVKVPPELECLWVCLAQTTYVCALYNPPNASTEKLLIDHVINTCLNLTEFNSEIRVICAGDFNSAPANLMNAFVGVRNLVLVPTHGNNTLDLVLTNTPQHYGEPRILPPIHHSKHNSVFLTSTL